MNSSVASNRIIISLIVLTAFVFCAECRQNEAVNDLEKNKEIVQRVFEEVWNKGNLDVADDCIAAGFMRHDPTAPDENWGTLDNFKQEAEGVRNAFPEQRMNIEDIIAEGDRVAIRFTSTGTHKGELNGVPATGNTIDVTGYEILRIKNGKIAEWWHLGDMFTLMGQLGLLPSTSVLLPLSLFCHGFHG